MAMALRTFMNAAIFCTNLGRTPSAAGHQRAAPCCGVSFATTLAQGPQDAVVLLFDLFGVYGTHV